MLSDIINELVDADGNLSSALLKTKVLSSRIDNAALNNWVSKELDGYDEDETPPEYRRLSARVTMNYINGNLKLTKQPIPMNGMNKGTRSRLENIELRQTMATLQSFSQVKGNDILSVSVSAETVAYVQNYIEQTGNTAPNFLIISIDRVFSVHAVSQILAVVRSRLLSFMLQIEKEFGSITDIESLKSKNQQITHIVNNTINNTGDGNMVNTGNSSTVNATITINKGDLVTLENKLRELGLQTSDINDLRNVINTETPDAASKRFGPQVNQWLRKMLDKAMDGSWQIGIGTAGGVLAEIINSYYGIK